MTLELEAVNAVPCGTNWDRRHSKFTSAIVPSVASSPRLRLAYPWSSVARHLR